MNKVKTYTKIRNGEEIELVKFIAILLLPAVHIIEFIIPYANGELIYLSNFIISLCATGPITFLMCMGYKLGTHKKYSSAIRDGIQFLLLGVILNILRWIIPKLTFYFITPSYTLTASTIFTDLLKSDIYYFVGFFFILYGILKKLKINNYGMLIIGILLCIINLISTPYILDNLYNDTLKVILGNFIYTGHTSCFPLCTYFMFPIFGNILGEYCKKNSTKKISVTLIIISIISIIITILLCLRMNEYMIDIKQSIVAPFNDYKLDVYGTIIDLCLTLILYTIIYFLYKLIAKTNVRLFIIKVSNLIIPFYFFQWIIISWLIEILQIMGCEQMTITTYVIMTVIVTISCVILSILIGKQFMNLLLTITNFTQKIGKKKRSTAS